MYYDFFETMHEKASMPIQRKTIQTVLDTHYIHILILNIIKRRKDISIRSLDGLKKIMVLFTYATAFKTLIPCLRFLPKKCLVRTTEHLTKVDTYILDFIDSSDLRPCGPLYLDKAIRVSDLDFVNELLLMEACLRQIQDLPEKNLDMSFQGGWRSHIICQVIELRQSISKSFDKSIHGAFYSSRVYVFVLVMILIYSYYMENSMGLWVSLPVIKVDLFIRILKLIYGTFIHVFGKWHVSRWKKVLMIMQAFVNGSSPQNRLMSKKLNHKVRRWEFVTSLLNDRFENKKDQVALGHIYLCMGIFAMLNQMIQYL